MADELMKCPSCGKEIKAEAKICRFCRAEITGSSESVNPQEAGLESPPVAASPPPVSAPVAAVAKPRRALRAFLVLIIVFLAMALVVVAIFDVFYFKKYGLADSVSVAGNYANLNSDVTIEINAGGTVKVSKYSGGTEILHFTREWKFVDENRIVFPYILSQESSGDGQLPLEDIEATTDGDDLIVENERFFRQW